MTEVKTSPGGTPKWTRDATANDSDKSFTVPTGKVWKLTAVVAELVATATVGNRILRCMITTSAGDPVQTFNGTGNIAASGRGGLWLYQCIGSGTGTWPGIVNGTAVTVGAQTPLPSDLFLPAGYIIRVWDISAIDAAADDMTVVLHYIEYEA